MCSPSVSCYELGSVPICAFSVICYGSCSVQICEFSVVGGVSSVDLTCYFESPADASVQDAAFGASMKVVVPALMLLSLFSVGSVVVRTASLGRLIFEVR